MASEWARKKAESFRTEVCDCPENAGRKRSGQGAYRRFYCSSCFAAALDEAVEMGREAAAATKPLPLGHPYKGTLLCDEYHAHLRVCVTGPCRVEGCGQPLEAHKVKR